MVERFPAQITPTFVAVVEDDGEPEPILVAGRTVGLQLDVTGPDGEVLFLVEQTPQEIGAKPWPSLPPRLQMVAQVPITASKPGEYVFRATLTVHGMDQPIVASRTTRINDVASLSEGSPS